MGSRLSDPHHSRTTYEELPSRQDEHNASPQVRVRVEHTFDRRKPLRDRRP
ncbi:hypothetical protein AB0896_17270 [Streptomyces parvulus]|uniref:hypothetical protein n=1 Tax=Streptomyces parvulus TaxID=146923 RepID=UPI00340B6840